MTTEPSASPGRTAAAGLDESGRYLYMHVGSICDLIMASDGTLAARGDDAQETERVHVVAVADMLPANLRPPGPGSEIPDGVLQWSDDQREELTAMLTRLKARGFSHADARGTASNAHGS